jgi:predicted MPP superfamily phosphohydrolase
MSKTIFLGDTHGRSTWKDIIRNEIPDRVVFIGDYFDSHDKELTAATQMFNFKEIIEFKKTGAMEVIMLIGNHDYHYFPEIGYNGTSGYQAGAAPEIGRILDENREHLQMAYLDNKAHYNILCTHAGVGYNWLVEQMGYNSEDNIADFINDIWKYKSQSFQFNGFNPYGDSKTQTPIWIRPGSLLSGNKNTFLKEQYIQIVGHTQVTTIDMGKATGGKYYFIDALGTCQEYLIYEDGVFSKNSIS